MLNKSRLGVLLLSSVLSVFLYGCASRNVVTLEEKDLTSYLQKDSKSFLEGLNSALSPIAPKNLVKYDIKNKKNCQIIINRLAYDPNDKQYQYYWSGECKDGLAQGMGRLSIKQSNQLIMDIIGQASNESLTNNSLIYLYNEKTRIVKSQLNNQDYYGSYFVKEQDNSAEGNFYNIIVDSQNGIILTGNTTQDNPYTFSSTLFDNGNVYSNYYKKSLPSAYNTTIEKTWILGTSTSYPYPVLVQSKDGKYTSKMIYSNGNMLLEIKEDNKFWDQMLAKFNQAYNQESAHIDRSNEVLDYCWNYLKNSKKPYYLTRSQYLAPFNFISDKVEKKRKATVAAMEQQRKIDDEALAKKIREEAIAQAQIEYYKSLQRAAEASQRASEATQRAADNISRELNTPSFSSCRVSNGSAFCTHY